MQFYGLLSNEVHTLHAQLCQYRCLLHVQCWKRSNNELNVEKHDARVRISWHEQLRRTKKQHYDFFHFYKHRLTSRPQVACFPQWACVASWIILRIVVLARKNVISKLTRPRKLSSWQTNNWKICHFHLYLVQPVQSAKKLKRFNHPKVYDCWAVGLARECL